MYPSDALETLTRIIESHVPRDSMDRTDAERALDSLEGVEWELDE